MTARTYYAAVKSATDPETLTLIGEGSRDRCEGAIDAWSALKGEPTGTPVILVEVPRGE